MQQIQFAKRVKKAENRNRKNRTHVQRQKILHNFDEILKMRLETFPGCRGYLPKAKSP